MPSKAMNPYHESTELSSAKYLQAGLARDTFLGKLATSLEPQPFCLMYGFVVLFFFFFFDVHHLLSIAGLAGDCLVEHQQGNRRVHQLVNSMALTGRPGEFFGVALKATIQSRSRSPPMISNRRVIFLPGKTTDE